MTLRRWRIFGPSGIWVLGIFLAWSYPGTASAQTCNAPGPVLADVTEFVRADCYTDWRKQARHLSGAKVDGKYFTVHQDIEVYFSSEIANWLDGKSTSIQNGAIVVALERPHGRPNATPAAVLVKALAKGSSVDGWFWSTVPLNDERSPTGKFGDSTCLSCHAAASAFSTFLSGDGPKDATGWRPDPSFVFPDAPKVDRRLPKPLADADPAFLKTYGIDSPPKPDPLPGRDTDHVPARGNQQFMTSGQCRGCHNAGQRLSNSRPNLWYPDPASDDPTYRNYSPYGEWSASMHSFAARDPIFHAAMEAEYSNTPAIKDFVYDTCLSCHSPMAGRQLKVDTGDPSAQFPLELLFADHPDDPGYVYGALARDGISCAFCHRATGELLGVDLPPANAGDVVELDQNGPYDPSKGYHLFLKPGSLGSYDGNLTIDTTGRMFGPHATVNGTVMQNATSFAPTGDSDADQMTQAAFCGSCHTPIVPVVPESYSGDNPLADSSLKKIFDQTTYWEWRNSFWENESKASGLTCQGCHMAPNRGSDGRLTASRIANIESDRFPPVQGRLGDTAIQLAEQFPVSRHTFLGINLFAIEMFKQFPEILGSRLEDPTVPEQTLDPLLNASDWQSDHAERDTLLVTINNLRTAAVETVDSLSFDVQVANYAGHKFPTGFGTRRALVEVAVLDDKAQVLWSSGATSSSGVIVDGESGDELASEWTDEPSKSQPHHTLITRQDQVQIYETRSADADGKLQSRVLGAADVYKDNRIVPMGWATEPAAGGGTFQADRRFPNKGSVNMFAIHPVLPVGGESTVPEQGALGTSVPSYCADPKSGTGYDPYYCDPAFTQFGADVVSYQIPVNEIKGWACVQARVLYQSVPPYYMRNLISGGGPAAQRLAYIASRMNWDDSAIDDWTLQVGNLASVNTAGGSHAHPMLRSCGSDAGRHGANVPEGAAQ